jgi:hypothetical protein
MGIMKATPDDIQPVDDMDLDGGSVLPAGQPGGTALAVPFTGEQLVQIERIARERGIQPTEAVQRLVEEGLEARARKPAA